MEQYKPSQCTAVVVRKLQLTKNVYHFFFHPEEPSEFLFVPGQYVTFIIDPQTRRQYSLCSAPNPLSFELIVDVSPMGPGSKYFLEKKEGDRVDYLGPLGNFTLNDNPLRKVFVATGTGIAPFRSMLLNEIQRNKDIKKQSEKDLQNSLSPDISVSLSLSLYWGLRHEDDMYWDTEFRTLVGQYTGFQYFFTLSKPTPHWTGLTGHVTDHVFKNEKNLENSEFYLCGNKAMITDMKNRLSAKNIKNGRIKMDMFY